VSAVRVEQISRMFSEHSLAVPPSGRRHARPVAPLLLQPAEQASLGGCGSSDVYAVWTNKPHDPATAPHEARKFPMEPISNSLTRAARPDQ
jgi:hypothetical protein